MQLHYIVVATVDGDRIRWEMDNCDSPSLPGWAFDEDKDEWHKHVPGDHAQTDHELTVRLCKMLERMNYSDD